MKAFHVGHTAAAMGLAIYVIGCTYPSCLASKNSTNYRRDGVGPLLLSPMSEIARFGRNWVYVPTFCLFVILSIPTAVVKNYAGLLVLRFVQGFLGSPALANGGASVGDMVSPLSSA